ncbi:hypothetical protein [Scytonema hofmannii]|uniref:hypothetical protein n=1 Tax=Scytonema hofmannii TaxID=34078 RepID=UPI0003467079
MFTIEHLNYAWLQVRAGSKAAGVDGISVDLFESIATEELRNLAFQIQHETYTTSPAKGFYVPKKNGGKRLVGISTVRDRIVQRSFSVDRWSLFAHCDDFNRARSHCSAIATR